MILNLPLRAPHNLGRSILRRGCPSVAWLAVCLVGSSWAAVESAPVAIPMTAEHWTANGDAVFESHLGTDSAVVRKGILVANGVAFQDGTIEFDVDPFELGAGVGFRRKDPSTFECVYLRPNPMKPGASDGIQYTPQLGGALLWDLFPQYQSAAPLRLKQWNHMRLVISGQRMDVYINGAQNPTLHVGRLEGNLSSGELLLQGPAAFSNLVVSPGRVDKLEPEAEKDPTWDDAGLVRHWQISSLQELPGANAPTVQDLPPVSGNWKPLEAERGGLVNVSREYGLPLKRPNRALVWLKTTVKSDGERVVHTSVGWAREIWVFVNGQAVYADKNLYTLASARKAPDGRCSLENGSFALPLRAGENEVVVALANNFYGWGLIWRINDLTGIELPKW